MQASPPYRPFIAKFSPTGILKRLKLLGGAHIDAGDSARGAVTGRAVQRRRIALLALLSIRARGAFSRDKLIAYLWPDADSDRGRHLLSDSVYRINQELGSDTILAIGDELKLDCDAVGCDVLEFEQAIDGRDFKHAVELYEGPFLDGFFLSECVELERWIEQERERLARMHLSVLEALGAASTAQGDREAAVMWWRRAATQDPYNSKIALRLMEALAAAGNRPAALQHAQLHATLVRSDFGTEPDPALQQYADRLKRGDAGEVAAPATPLPPAPPPLPPSTPAPTPESGTPAPQATPAASRSRYTLAGLSLAGLAVVALVALLVRREPASAGTAAVVTTSSDSARGIAVLPFLNLSTDPADAFFADAITDEVTTALDRVKGLNVAARTSAFAFKDMTSDIREVAGRLRVASVVEGSVRKDGRRMRIVVRLIDAGTGYRLWSADYEREVSDAFAVHAEIARSIATALQQQIAPVPNEASSSELSRDSEAYELFLKGRFAWHRRTEQSLREARQHFEAAVARVPSYARAWAGLADAYAVSAFYDYVAPRDGYPKAEEAARRALALDSTLAGPHATLGYVNLYYHWNWPIAEEAFLRAIRLAPEYSTAHQWYGNFLTAMGRFPEAKAAFARATEAEPLSLIASAASGWSRYYARSYDEAEQHFAHTLDLEPNYELAHLWRGQTLDIRGRSQEAIASLGRAVELSKRSSLTLAALAHALARAGREDSARGLVKEIEARAPERYVPPYEIAKVYVALGDTAAAWNWFDRAFRERAHAMVLLKVDPQLAGLARHQRYAALLQRVGLK
ncbi:MAG TPA: BTAD domain-containing putative transcriptional regulator [Gemmatimonadaceae bacterium]|nr:BTAD domain-containing putative transcriptional regulator [Gemmatimonadaceae bacterium]